MLIKVMIPILQMTFLIFTLDFLSQIKMRYNNIVTMFLMMEKRSSMNWFVIISKTAPINNNVTNDLRYD